jgi:phage terminase large subunit-like protein
MIRQKYVDEYLEAYESGKILFNKERVMLVEYLKKYVLSNDDLYFNEKRINDCIKFIEKWFFPTAAYQRFIIAFTFLYNKQTDDVYYDEFLLVIGRGAGKNGLISGLSAYFVSSLNGIPGYNGSIVANSEDQAMTSITEIYNVVQSHSRLSKEFDARKSAITGRATNSTVTYQTSNGKTKDGLRDGFDVFDEIHMYPDSSGVGVYESGLGKRPESRQYEVGSNGFVRDGYLDGKIEIAIQVMAGELPPDTMFPFICKIDTEDEADDPTKWQKANPTLEEPRSAYGKTLFRKIMKQYNKLQAEPSGREEFMTKRMDFPKIDLEKSVAPYEQIKATNVVQPDIADQEVIGAVDFASLRDFAACGISGRKGDKIIHFGHQFARKQFVDKYYGYSLSEDQRRKFRNAPPIRKWEQQGLLTVLNTPTIDPRVVVNYFVEIRKRYNLKKVVIDNYRADVLRRAFEEVGIEIDTIKNPTSIDGLLAPRIEDGFAQKKFIWGDNPLLRWNTQNVLVKVDPQGNKKYLKKEEARRKTDGFKCFEYTLYRIDEISESDVGEFLDATADLDF